MDKQTPDVAVVGASAAGLAAAWAAADAGADVLLLESRADVGLPAALGMVAFDFLWPPEVPQPRACILRRLEGVRVRSPGGRSVAVDAPLSLLDRAAFDRHLAREAAARGARVLTGVKGVRAQPDRALVADGLEVRAPVVIFADGARTMARRFLRPTRDPDQMAWGSVLAFDEPGSEAETRVGITVGSHAWGGRSQLNPLGGDEWTHWTFYRGSPKQAEAEARRALALDARLHGWDEEVAARAAFCGVAPDPVYTMPDELCANGVMVVGGAAGQGGIEMGIAAGVLAGQVAASSADAMRTDRAALMRYEQAWKSRYLPGYRTLRFFTGLLARLEDEEIDEFIGSWRGHIVQVDHLADLATRGRRLGGLFQLAAFNSKGVPVAARMVARAARRRPRPPGG